MSRSLRVDKPLPSVPHGGRVVRKRAPIMNLPPELLAEVFHLLNRTVDIITLSHVCGVWREVTLANPLLWTTVDLTGFQDVAPDWMATLLARAGVLPVDVINLSLSAWNYSRDAERRTMDSALSRHLDHIRTLGVAVSTRSLWENLQNNVLVTHSAPILERLAISVLYLDGIGPTVQRRIFSENAPRLTTLELRGVRPARGGCAAFSSVRSFRYERPNLESVHAMPSLAAIFPQLKEYTLIHSAVGPSTEPLGETSILEKMTIESKLDPVIEVLDHFVPDGHENIQELRLDCPFSSRSANYVLCMLMSPLDITVYGNMRARATGVDGRSVVFVRRLSFLDLSEIILSVSGACATLFCSASFACEVLHRRPTRLPYLTKLTIDLRYERMGDTALTTIFDTSLTPILSTLKVYASRASSIRPDTMAEIARRRRDLGNTSFRRLVLLLESHTDVASSGDRAWSLLDEVVDVYVSTPLEQYPLLWRTLRSGS